MAKKALPKKRLPVAALLLSIFAPGLGQVYNAQFRKGIITALLVELAIFSLSTPIISTFYGFGLASLLALFSYLYAVLDPLIVTARNKEVKLQSYNRWYIYLSLLIGSFALTQLNFYVLTHARYQVFHTGSVSMEPTLTDGDRFVVDRDYYRNRKALPDDLVVVSYPSQQDIKYICRCIAVGGQTVEIKNRAPYVDHKPVRNRGYSLRFLVPMRPVGQREEGIFPPGAGNSDNYGPVLVPEGKYFLLGDNIANCRDTRYWGFVDDTALRGRPLFVCWSTTLSRIDTELN